MKAIKETGFDDALTDRHVARQLDQASRAVVECCRLALQCIDGRFNLFCMDQQLLAMRCQSVSPACRSASEQSRAASRARKRR